MTYNTRQKYNEWEFVYDPRKDPMMTQQGVAGQQGRVPGPGGVNTGGANPGGINPGGTNPGGINPGGINPGGTNPGGGSPFNPTPTPRRP
jgi:hypothetical protein